MPSSTGRDPGPDTRPRTAPGTDPHFVCPRLTPFAPALRVMNRDQATLPCFCAVKKSPEGHEILHGPVRVTGQGDRFELWQSLADATAEHDATHSRRRAAPGDLSGSFPA